jgi:cytochrome c-type biogenesis protein CcmH/NrfG
VIARALVLVAALAGFGVLVGDLDVARDVDRAVALSRSGHPDRALPLLRSAAARTADTTPRLREAQLQLFRRRPREAVAPARAVVRREPENAQAWLALAQAAEGSGEATLARDARRRVVELVARP